ncbi:MAG: ABC transporter permease [Desulfobacteraceae bacterium 4572_130]|nr:MAG: ABC transporter permease [Desulfobacteraceae bacterium 4572_130]
MIGRFKISISILGTILSDIITGDTLSPDFVSQKLVFLWIRLPRCIMAVLVGMCLSVSGGVYQAMFRNPLVSPAVAMTISIARLISIKPIIVMVLAGMVVLSFFNALLMILKYFSDPYDELPSIVFWIMGSLTRVTWHDVFITLAVTSCGLLVFILLRFRLNILSLGDIQAKSLGINPFISRVILIVLSSFMVAMVVATCGQIAWLGLIIPHMARTLVGPKHETMIPVTALLGAIFMLAADVLARSMTTAEIPVGIITAITGAPIFCFLLYKNRGSGWL